MMRSLLNIVTKPFLFLDHIQSRIQGIYLVSNRCLHYPTERTLITVSRIDQTQKRSKTTSATAEVIKLRKYVSKLNVSEALDKAAFENSTKTAYLFKDGVSKTFSEFHRDVAAFAGGVQHLGLAKNARVAIFAPTCYEWLVAKYAINWAGCVVVAMNSGAYQDEVVYALEKTGTEAIIIGDVFKYMDYYQTICEVFPELKTKKALDSKRTLKHIISISTDKKPGTFTFRELQSSGPVLDAQMKPDDPAVIIQSSGSTGEPKSVVLSHGNVVSAAYQSFSTMRLRHSNIVLASLPLYHSFGYLCVEANNTLNGLTTVFTSASPKPSEIIEMIERHRVTTLHGTPTTFFDILCCPDFGQRNLSCVENATIGATTLHPSVIENVINKLHLKELMLGYGLTETSGACSYADGKAFRGYAPFPGTKFRIAKANNDVIVDGSGIQGELQIRGPTLFLEYLNDEKKTREAFTDDGWFRTGDLGYLNKHGLFEICGRTSDLIIKGGVNIFPVEVEKVLLEHPAIAEAHVLGVFDERFGEEICAWIKLRPDTWLSAGSVIRYCAGKLQNIKIPKHVVFASGFPRTNVGKVSKKLLREAFEKHSV
ncbi:acyl-CoA synthetase family member 2, mitochondrial-like isoform X4 [Varroa destructor]|uniref:Medium-chain acyl-CoA ligase ACSF2, mitochondrial n=1 Tax=Varroa destructor TaxID=109461 RepID=A0A7M7K144_VARDE|nr:acyl-CoA synthetase family member 2, mitochondrial-like isoform X4 [Varroa destructor]